MKLAVLPHMIRRQSFVSGLDDDEFVDIALFRERMEKLVVAQKKYQRLPISKTTRHADSDQIEFASNTPHFEEVASLARNFRFFFAEKEPTQFQKILSKVRRRAQDEWACNYLDRLSMLYKATMKDTQVSAGLGHAVTNRQIIDLWFNSELFHSEQAKRDALIDIHDAIGEAPSLFQLYTAIVSCSAHVRSLYSVVHLLTSEHQFIYSPNYHFAPRQQSEQSNA